MAKGKLTASLDGFYVGEGINDSRESSPREQHDVGNKTPISQPERTMLNVVATLDKQADNGDAVRKVQQLDTSCNH